MSRMSSLELTMFVFGVFFFPGAAVERMFAFVADVWGRELPDVHENADGRVGKCVARKQEIGEKFVCACEIEHGF